MPGWRVYVSVIGAILILLANGIDKNFAGTSVPAIPGLPSPLRLTGYSPSSTFFSEEEDLKIIGEVFNAVVINHWYVRHQQWEPIQKIIDAGLVPIIGFSDSKYLFRGEVETIRQRTDEIIAGVKAAPFSLKFIKVADELNYGRIEEEELQTIEEIVTYLDMTARRLKEAGLVTFVDANSPELYNQTTDREVFTIAGLNAIIATGYVDGIFMGNPGHRRGDEAVIAQWTKARELWPSIPFFCRTASFQFTERTFEESGKNADDLIRWTIDIPNSLGSLGYYLRTWRVESSDGSVSHIRNADGQSNEAWDALIDVVKRTNVHTPPKANDDIATTAQDTPITIDVAYNDTDTNGNVDPGSALEIVAPSNGTLVNNNDGTFDYTPSPSFNGPDSFVYEICDTDLLCDTATVSITVTPPNDPPVANEDSGSGGGGGGCLISTAAYGFRVSKEILAFVLFFGSLLIGFSELRKMLKK